MHNRAEAIGSMKNYMIVLKQIIQTKIAFGTKTFHLF